MSDVKVVNIESQDKFLWRFYWDCGRQGSIESVFAATQKQIDSALGKPLYFGEVLGKHSEIYGTFGAEDITKLELEPELVEKVCKILGDVWSGLCPLWYLQEEE